MIKLADPWPSIRPPVPNGTALTTTPPDTTTTKEWPALDLTIAQTSRSPAPAFPVEVLGPWADWATKSAAKVSAPVDYVAMPLIALAGSTMANCRWGSPWNGWQEPPIMNVGLVGLPSSGKSPALDMVFDPLRRAERELAKDFPSQWREWKRLAVAAEARKKIWTKAVGEAAANDAEPPELPADAEPPPEPKSPRLFTTDATTEAAEALAKDHPKGLAIIRDELAGWIAGLDRYGSGEGGGDRAFWIETYGGKAKVKDRVKFDGAEQRVANLSVAIIGGIQPDRLETMLLAGDDDGLAARFCLVWPEPVPLIRPDRAGVRGSPVAAFIALRNLQPAQMDGETFPKSVPFSEDAGEALHSFRIRNKAAQEAASGLHLSWLGKLPGMVLRVATILEHLWWSAAPEGERGGPWQIGGKSVESALLLVESYLIPMALRVMGETALPQNEKDATALARWIRAQEPVPGSVNARQLRRSRAISTREASRYDAAIAELVAGGWLRPDPSRHGGGPGRSTKDFEVNPAITAKK